MDQSLVQVKYDGFLVQIFAVMGQINHTFADILVAGDAHASEVVEQMDWCFHMLMHHRFRIEMSFQYFWHVVDITARRIRVVHENVAMMMGLRDRGYQTMQCFLHFY